MLKFREIKTEEIEDVLSDVTVTDDGCYLYPYVMGNGYAQYQKNGKHYLVHRMMKAFDSQKDIEDGLVVHHTCGNPNCVNPNHLKVMTPKEHMRIHNVRLDKQDIFAILDLFNTDRYTLKELSSILRFKQIFVSYSYISKLVNGKVREDIVSEYRGDSNE